VKVLSFEGLANRNDPKSCVWMSNHPGEALTGERAGQLLSCETHLKLQRADVVPLYGRQYFCQSISETGKISAQSKTLYMLGNTLHGNWESQRLPEAPGCIGKSKDESQ